MLSAHRSHHRPDNAPVSHDPEVGTVSLRLDRAASLEGVRRWLDTLLWEKVEVMDIFRIKGVLHVSDGSNKHVVQVRCNLCHLHESACCDTKCSHDCTVCALSIPVGCDFSTFRSAPALSTVHQNRVVMQAVHELYDIVEGPCWQKGEQRATRIVVIGRNLSRTLLQTTLERSCYGDGEAQ
jgi:G3E family GTPase